MMVHPTPLWRSDEAAAATKGDAHQSWQAFGVSIDSRTLSPGDLFVAIKGDHSDGHAYVDAAMENGAVAAVVHTAFANERDDPALGVANPTMALTDLGRAARARTDATIIGVTGSVGKTGTKEALSLALSAQGATHATLGNLNNHFGVPLTLARMPQATAYGVIEMGMNHANEIRSLSRLARPHIAIITAIAPAHIEFFEGIEGIADAKAEIFEGLEPGGAAILPRDSDQYQRLLQRATEAEVQRIFSFGVHAEANARLISVARTNAGSLVEAELMGKSLSFKLGVTGDHHALNALSVLLAVELAGADVTQAAESLADLKPTKGRGDQRIISYGADHFVLIDESYNASPASMEAALQELAKSPVAGGGRRIAVLGDMLELGAQSESLHAALADTLNDLNIDLVFTCGQYMGGMFDLLADAHKGAHAMTAEKLVPAVIGTVSKHDVVLVKGSLGSRTGKIVTALAKLADGPLALETAGGS